MELIPAAEKQKRLLLGLCRRAGQGLGDGFCRQRNPALRSGKRKIRELPVEQARRRGAPDAWPGGRSLGRGIGDGSAGGGEVLTRTTGLPAQRGRRKLASRTRPARGRAA